LLDELKETAAPTIAGLAEDERADVDEIVAMLTGNLEKIAEHGRRADGIVMSMLEHFARGKRRAPRGRPQPPGPKRRSTSPITARARPEVQHHAGTRFRRGHRPDRIGAAGHDPVCLNLFGNGFYAVTKRQKEGGDATFQPTLKASTQDLGGAVEIRIRDNGVGIPPEIRDKLFQPFFTTKPTGEGTGLGLSISWDIVTQQHAGTIAVDSRVGEFTEFAIRLPRVRAAPTTEAAA
jgi:hypothetical protein